MSTVSTTAFGWNFARSSDGPPSQKNEASATYRGMVWFHFGD